VQLYCVQCWWHSLLHLSKRLSSISVAQTCEYPGECVYIHVCSHAHAGFTNNWAWQLCLLQTLALLVALPAVNDVCFGMSVDFQWAGLL
jgi:hypothetical protein